MATGSKENPSALNGAEPRPLDEQVLPIFAETIAVRRERHETARVRATVVTHSHEQLIDEDLLHERIHVERVPIGRVVETTPEVREENGTVIIPVVEEILVVERRLILKEEVHLRRVRSHEKHMETVVVRSQDVQVTRTDTGPETPVEPRPAEDPLINNQESDLS